MDNIIEKCKKTRILATIGIICVILGVILPYIKYNILGISFSFSLWEFWEGKVVIALAIANLLFIFKDEVERFAPFLFNSEIGKKIQNCENSKMSLIPTVLVVIFVIYLTVDLGIDTFEYYNIGFYAMWIGIISLVAYAFLHKESKD